MDNVPPAENTDLRHTRKVNKTGPEVTLCSRQSTGKLFVRWAYGSTDGDCGRSERQYVMYCIRIDP